MEVTARVVKDAEVRHTKTDKDVVAFSLVINDDYKSKSGEVIKVATYIDCSYWLGTGVSAILKKGAIVTVTGRIGINAYKTRDNEYHAHLTFHANTIKLISSAGKGAAGSVDAHTTPETKEDLPF